MYMLANGEEEGGIVKYINNQIAIKNDDFSKIKLAYTSAVRVDGCYGFEIYLSKEDIEKGLITGNIAAREEFDVDIRGNVLVENLQKLFVHAWFSDFQFFSFAKINKNFLPLKYFL